MGWLVVLGALPWVLVALLFLFGFREPRPLPPSSARSVASERRLPSVAIVVPARNEERNIGPCLESLVAQEYPEFRVVVVDDRSTDRTGDVARSVAPGRSRELRVLSGAPLPDGWFGKPWACQQGADASSGELILFTDADTRHAPSLLHRAVEALADDRADALSLKGWQVLGSFGERLVQPHIFLLLGLRYRRLDRPVGPERPRDAIANGQYILISRDAYDGVGGHSAVRGEVVEDLRLAQVICGAGLSLSLRGAEDAFATRMYHSLREVVDGWTKNLAVGARQSVGGAAPLALPGILAFLVGLWILPPVTLLLSLALGGVGGSLSVPLTAWAAGSSAVGLLFWIWVLHRFGVAPLYALLYPVGAVVTAWIVVRSWLRGDRRVEWKGRRYARGRAAATGEGE